MGKNDIDEEDDDEAEDKEEEDEEEGISGGSDASKATGVLYLALPSLLARSASLNR